LVGRSVRARRYVNSSAHRWRRRLRRETHDRALEEELVALLVAEGNRPAAELVEAFDRVDEMAEVRVAPHLAVGEHRHASPCLDPHGIVDGAVLRALELGVGDGARRVAPAGILEVGGTQ
jgi:hypothetical protein